MSPLTEQSGTACAVNDELVAFYPTPDSSQYDSQTKVSAISRANDSQAIHQFLLTSTLRTSPLPSRPTPLTRAMVRSLSTMTMTRISTRCLATSASSMRSSRALQRKTTMTTIWSSRTLTTTTTTSPTMLPRLRPRRLASPIASAS